jgi:hypothetical protein
MAIPVIGSMAVKGVFKAGSLLSGLGSTGMKLKEVQQRSKSTSTEMKRMTKQSNLLRNALAAIGVAGFSALLMTTPQLAGALAKIKYEMQMIAWSIGKHLKPALDAVSTILRGIRTGDWSTVIRGVKDLGNSILGLVDKVVTVTVDTIFGEGAAAQAKKDFDNWISSLEKAWSDRDLPGLIEVSLWEPIQWAGEKIGEFQRGMMKELESERGAAKGKRHREFWVRLGETIAEFNLKGGQQIVGAIKGERRVGGYIPQTGLYKMHAGETVTMAGSTPSGVGGTTDITVDFSGANINLAGGIQLDQFADAISKKIAERQQSITY